MIALINKDRPGKKSLEKFADNILIPYRKLWYGKNVVELINNKNNEYTIQDHNSKGLIQKGWISVGESAPGGGIFPGVFAISMFVFTLLTAIPALVSLGVGLGLKKIAIYKDEKYRLYQDIVCKYPEYKKEKNEFDELDNKIKDINRGINGLNKIKDKIIKDINCIEGDIKGVIHSPLLKKLIRSKQEKLKRLQQKINKEVNNLKIINSDFEKRENKVNDLYNRLLEIVKVYDKKLGYEEREIHLKCS